MDSGQREPVVAGIVEHSVMWRVKTFYILVLGHSGPWSQLICRIICHEGQRHALPKLLWRGLGIIISRIVLYQASVSSLCDAPSGAIGMVSGVSRGMGVLDGVMIVEGEWAVLGVSLGRPIVSNRDFATRLFPDTLDRTCYYIRWIVSNLAVSSVHFL